MSGEGLDASGRPLGSCNCARYGNASRCTHHTQADFDAADLVRERHMSGDREVLAGIEFREWLCICAEQAAGGSDDEINARCDAHAEVVLAHVAAVRRDAAAEGAEKAWAEAIATVQRQTDLTDLVHFERPSDFRKGVLTSLMALNAARAETIARGHDTAEGGPA